MFNNVLLLFWNFSQVFLDYKLHFDVSYIVF